MSWSHFSSSSRDCGRPTRFAPSLAQPGELIERYRGVLPFTLTEHQERAITEIDLDLAQTMPMQRLLQGDVAPGRPSLRCTRSSARSRTSAKAR